MFDLLEASEGFTAADRSFHEGEQERLDAYRTADAIGFFDDDEIDLDDHDLGDDEIYDGQPDEYTEWQDYMGGDDWDQGQYDDGGEG